MAVSPNSCTNEVGGYFHLAKIERVNEGAVGRGLIALSKRMIKSQCSDGSNIANKTPSSLSRWVLTIAGTFFVGLGILGIFLPLLPTTPFLLLAAACYARSSERFYHWLLNNRWFGNYLKNYWERKGIPLKIKVLSISFLWITIGYSAVFVVQILLSKIILVLIAIGVTIHILSIRTLKHRPRDNSND